MSAYEEKKKTMNDVLIKEVEIDPALEESVLRQWETYRNKELDRLQQTLKQKPTQPLSDKETRLENIRFAAEMWEIVRQEKRFMKSYKTLLRVNPKMLMNFFPVKV
jgi:hypothetical protein